jgi:4-hydroxy-tetrahydrodipicolinate synthase
MTGTMPGTDLLDAVVQLWKALEQKDHATVTRLSGPICAIVALQLQAGLDGFLAVEKHLLVKRGLFPNERRRPPFGWRLDDETRKYVDELFDELKSTLNPK